MALMKSIFLVHVQQMLFWLRSTNKIDIFQNRFVPVAFGNIFMASNFSSAL
jgi:hypothetical protein